MFCILGFQNYDNSGEKIRFRSNVLGGGKTCLQVFTQR